MSLEHGDIAKFRSLLETLQGQLTAPHDGKRHDLGVNSQSSASPVPDLSPRNTSKERQTAHRFNIFRVLGVAYDEVKTHSALLANLLDPAGSHGQGYLFLESFLQICAQRAGCDSEDAPDFPVLQGDVRSGMWIVERERWIVFGESRADIIVRNPHLRYLLLIENKIGTEERDGQLLRYASWLKTVRDAYPQQALIYLTPDGRSALTEELPPYYCLSYRDDISAWLEELLGENGKEKVGAKWFRKLLSQYVEIIRNLQHPFEEKMMQYEKDVVDRIIEEGSLPTALEVADILEKWQLEMQRTFWVELHKNLSRRLREPRYSEEWEVVYNSPKGIGGCHEEWFTCGIQPRQLAPYQPFFRVEVQQCLAGEKFPLRLGIARSHPDNIEFEGGVEEIKLLGQSLLDADFRAHERWFVGLKDLDYALMSYDVLQQMYSSQPEVVEDVAELVWGLFKQNATLITEAQKALTRSR